MSDDKDDPTEIEMDPTGEEPVDLSISMLAEAMGEEETKEFMRAHGMNPEAVLDAFGEHKLADVDMAGFTGSVRSHQGALIFSDIHLQTAIELSEQVKAYEEVTPEEWGYQMNFGLVVSSVISCVSFLEGVINEFIDDVSGVKVPSHAETQEKLEKAGFDSDFQDLLSSLESEDIIVWRHMSTLDKYQAILAISDEERFDKGAMPYQDAKLLTRLRNYFVHYKPELYEYNQEEAQHRLGTALEGKYQENPLSDAHQPFFPHKSLSYGCTDWAIESSLDFNNAFFDKFGLQPSYKRRKEILEFKDYI